MLDDFPHASQFAAAVLYAAVNELLLQPAEYTCYNKTLDLIRDDPRVTVRLGEPVHAYGTESRNRSARQRIPHREYQDVEGRQHIQVCACVWGSMSSAAPAPPAAPTGLLLLPGGSALSPHPLWQACRSLSHASAWSPSIPSPTPCRSSSTSAAPAAGPL